MVYCLLTLLRVYPPLAFPRLASLCVEFQLYLLVCSKLICRKGGGRVQEDYTRNGGMCSSGWVSLVAVLHFPRFAKQLLLYRIVTDMVICYATAPKYTLHY
jgi:hypothetical protein